MKKLFLLAMMLLTMAPQMQAKVVLSHLIGDDMIIQQDTQASLWGTDEPRKTVTVTVSWSDKTYQTKVGEDGKWLVKVDTPKASYTPLSITFDDGEQTTIHNVLAGEVWICAGQSNMEMPVSGFDNCPVANYNDILVDSKTTSGVHFVKIPTKMSLTPLDDVDCSWQISSPTTIPNTTAVGYFFARMMNRVLDIPIGLVQAYKGGTRVESWLTRENLEKYTKEPLDFNTVKKTYRADFYYPLYWGNAIFNPILNYTVKGIIFYQGCSNVGDPGNQYSERLKLLVDQWRKQLGQGDIPFYFVQIAPFAGNDNHNPDGVSGAKLREQQMIASKTISNSELIGINDLVYPYEEFQIHPCQKQPVGERLAFTALNKLYDKKVFAAEYPEFKSMTISNDTIFAQFINMTGGMNRMMDIKGFEVAGEDKVFHKADAVRYRKTNMLAIVSTEVKHPVALRYCFRNFLLGNFGNSRGLPLFPFRTDNW
jgi:sialate O-acetylesterase